MAMAAVCDVAKKTNSVDGPAGPTLTLTGSCPGPLSFAVSGATPFGMVGLAYGPGGTIIIGGGPCAGMTLDLASLNIAGLFPADINGLMNLNANLPAGACGVTIQAVDISTCTPSNTEVL